ncbi:MAG TPA: xanthine dehydrogenase family protein subunit M [Acidimicrobiales bacterium]|nr:xanthine dehydrogenase family protein subunit M [Acidimicrobiales bacterium]
MKPSQFGYHQAASVDDAVSLLEAYEGSARILAGGQSLVPMLNMRLVRPDALVDINRLRRLSTVEVAGDDTILGALVRYSTIETAVEIAERLPLLRSVVTHIGDRQVRNRGTIGGSLCQGDATGEIPLACLVLDAIVSVTGPAGTRSIPLSTLYLGSYTTVLEPCEVLTSVRFAKSPGHHAFAEMCRRHNDFAVISVACAGSRTTSGTWNDVRIGLGGVAETPVRATAAETALSGTMLDEADLEQAGLLCLEAIDPPDDIRATAEYRRHLVPIYVRRVLRALRAATEGGAGIEGKDLA